jgi:hypothetical protein
LFVAVLVVLAKHSAFFGFLPVGRQAARCFTRGTGSAGLAIAGTFARGLAFPVPRLLAIAGTLAITRTVSVTGLFAVTRTIAISRLLAIAGAVAVAGTFTVARFFTVTRAVAISSFTVAGAVAITRTVTQTFVLTVTRSIGAIGIGSFATLQAVHVPTDFLQFAF